MLKTFSFFLTLCVILPQMLSQELIQKFEIVEGNCDYFLDVNNRYTCSLSVNVVFNPSDVLVINGTHLLGFTDEDVHAVYFRGNRVLYFNGEPLRKFINLKFLDITVSMFLQTIHQDAFAVCGQLEEVYISNTELSSLPFQMLRNCRNLRILNIGHNGMLSSIPAELFGAITNLEVFIARTAELSEIPDMLLRNMASLRVFDVHNNGINSLSLSVLSNVRNLEVFDISANNFSDQTAVMSLLQSQLGLRRIIISFNQFQMFNFIFFVQFSRLEELEIGGRSPMVGVSWFFPSNTLTRLTVIFVGENFPENAFYGFPNLRFLHLTGNVMIPNQVHLTIHKNTFKMSKNLENLRFANAQLAPLDPQLFKAQENLRHLEMRNCGIEELPDGIFATLVNLGFDGVTDSLNLASNRIRRLQLSAFGHHSRLRNLLLGGNNINKIQHGIFSRFINGTIFATFNGNECVSQTFSQFNNLDDHPALQNCFDNFEYSLTSTTPAMTTTTDGCGYRFGNFEFFFVNFVMILMVLVI